MFERFTRGTASTGAGDIVYVTGGQGPPVLLLHGHPQTHAMWHRVAPILAERYTVVASDLRGYGDSAKPESDPSHLPYSKRAMARDQVEVMAALGHERFLLAGHDRGARVAHRMALDHSDRVERLAVLDIAPTRDMYQRTDAAFAKAYFHWFFLTQPAGLPERLIGNDPAYWIERIFALSRNPGAFAPEAVAEYVRCFSDAAAIHATCEDYRAAATIDLEHDEDDLDRRVDCPVLVLWGEDGVVGRMFDPIALWRRRAREVQGAALPCGHFLPEEAPEETAAALEAFFAP